MPANACYNQANLRTRNAPQAQNQNEKSENYLAHLTTVGTRTSACRRTLATIKPILERKNPCKRKIKATLALPTTVGTRTSACRRTLAPTNPILELETPRKRRLFFYCVFYSIIYKGTLFRLRRLPPILHGRRRLSMTIYEIVVLVIMILNLIIDLLTFLKK